MSQKWWVDPAWDPMQDLTDCKQNISLMVPALEEHAQVLRNVVKQQQALRTLLKNERQIVSKLTQEVSLLRLMLEAQENKVRDTALVK
jgi:hypothetical protein